MVYGKYLLANNRLQFKVAFLLQAVVLWLLCSISIKSSQVQKREVFVFSLYGGQC